MLRVLYVLFFAFVLSFPASSQSNPPPPNSQAEQIRQLQADLRAMQNDRGNDRENLSVQTKGLTDLEKRVEDIHQYVAYWGFSLGITIALFGVLLTVLIIYFSFRAAREAKIEARQAAEDGVKNWIAEHSEAIVQPLNESLKVRGEEILADIRRQGNETLEKIEAKADQHHRRVNKLEDKIKTLLNRLSPSPDETGMALDPDDIDDLHHITDLLRQKPESHYTFDDWRILYLDATERNALDDITKCAEGMARTVAVRYS